MVQTKEYGPHSMYAISIAKSNINSATPVGQKADTHATAIKYRANCVPYVTLAEKAVPEYCGVWQTHVAWTNINFK
jgi:hypothetical protein